MTRGVDLSRTFRMAYLIRKAAPDSDSWESSFEESPLDHGKRLDKLKMRMEINQLGSELNGRLLNLYA